MIVDGRQYELSVTRQGDTGYRVSGGDGTELVDVLDPLTHMAAQGEAQAKHGGGHRVNAYMPGRVVRVLVEDGTEVEAGQGLLVLEAMKMENEIAAEHEGRVRHVFVEEGQAVEGGDPLVEIE